MKHLQRARLDEREGSKGDDKEGATARRAMEKSKYVRIIETKDVRGDDSKSNSFSLLRSEVAFRSQRG